MQLQPVVIEYAGFMNWLQNHCPALYLQYWRVIEPALEGHSFTVRFPSDNKAVTKKWEQVTGDYLVYLQSK